MELPTSPGGAYGVQVLIAGRQKHWRDEVSSQIRRAGYAATTVDCGVDAMTVLALGLPVDVLVTDVSLKGKLCCQKLALEARALRPDLRIVFASDLESQSRDAAPFQTIDAMFDRDFPDDGREGLMAVRCIDNVATTVRDALRNTD
ncbi:histidine kinase [Methylobacterium sp. J-068]|uniref:histidine kinase n=1 Tax=Methylobacterium sp. J-068 TaxID=2836649 RepID=UPI001FBAEA85|nr:histidine kinase [Methylobacterium sp. J-068]MCJ2036760.1 histidine kinase [Methylobacterium sp. J-068]